MVEGAVYATLGLPKISPASISNSTLSAPPAVTNAAALASNPTVISGTALSEGFVQDTVKVSSSLSMHNNMPHTAYTVLFWHPVVCVGELRQHNVGAIHCSVQACSKQKDFLCMQELLAILDANQAAPLQLAALFEPYLYLLQLNPELYAYSFAEGEPQGHL